MSLVSTLTPLGANKVWASGVQQIPRAISITGSVYSDQSGTLTIQQGGALLTLPAPSGLAAAAVGSGGTFTAGPKFWVITGLNGNGETVGSTEATTTIVSNGSATLTWTTLAGATGYKIYRGIATGGENFVATVGTVTTYTDTGTAATGAVPPPTGAAYVWDVNSNIAVTGGNGEGFDIPLLSPFFQLQYTNGSTPQVALRLFADARDPYGLFTQAPGTPSPGGAFLVMRFDPNAQAYDVVGRFDGVDGLDVNGQAAIFQNTSGKYASFAISAATVSNETIQETSVHVPTTF